MATIPALGMIETRGMVALVEATDTMLKEASVEMLGWRKVGKGLVTSFVSGDVAAVKSAIAAGEAAAAKVGEVAVVHIIPRPHEGLDKLYPPQKPKRAAHK